MDLPSGEAGADSIGRRRLLKKAAIGTAAAWVAPTILSNVAYAQGSAAPHISPSTVDVLRCDNLTKTPTTIGTGGGGDPVIPYPAGTVPGDLILVSASVNQTTAATFNVTTNAGTPVGFTQLYNITNSGGVVTSLWYLSIPVANAGTGVLVTFSGLSTPAPVTVAALRVAGASTLDPTYVSNLSTTAATTGGPGAALSGTGFLAINITATDKGAAPFTPLTGWGDNGNASLNGSGSGCGTTRPDLGFASKFEGTDVFTTSWATSRVWTSITFKALP